MSGRRASLELKPVPEYDKFSAASIGPWPAIAHASTPHANVQRSDTIGRSGGGGGGGGGGSGGGGLAATTSRSLNRNASMRSQGGPLGRTSLVAKLQQSGRQLIDLGRLQANWLSDTLVKPSEAQDYVNEEDQGIVALLARHVDLPTSAWQALLGSVGASNGHFWQSGIAGGVEFSRASQAATAAATQPRREQDVAPPDAAEAGAAQQKRELKPRLSIFGLPVIQPYNLFAVLWTLAMLLLDLVYTAFWVPMNVAFCTKQYGNLSAGCTISDLVGGMMYFINCLLGFQIGVVATHGYRKRTVVDGRLVAWLYSRYGRFWLDFVASVPFVYLVVVLAGRLQLNKGWVNCLSLLRLLRMVRLVSITKVVYMDSMSGRFQDSALARRMSVTFVYSLFLTYQLAVAVNLLSCIMVLCAYFQGYDKSWMTSLSWVDVTTASPVYQWYSAVYWMIVAATTTGFGDFQPRSVAEQVVANVAMMGGMIMFGVLVASIGNALSRATAAAHQAYGSRRKIMHVMEWAEHRELPPEIRKQVQNFYADKYGSKQEDEVDSAVMSELPSRLRADVAREMCVPLMCNCHILMELPANLQGLVAENMRPLRLPAGEDLCQQGDVADCFWVLQEGSVQAVRYKEGAVTVSATPTTGTDGEVTSQPRLLGESVLLGDVAESCRVRPWTLRTVTPCRLWGITIGELWPLMRMYPAIGLLAAEYVKFKVVYTYNGDTADEHWCELAAVILKQLQERMPEAEAGDLIRDLWATSGADGSLQTYLEQLLLVCTAHHGAAGLLGPASFFPFQARSSRFTGAIPLQRDLSATSTDGPIGGGGGGGGGGPAPQQPQQSAAAATPSSVFGTAAAAAALAAALAGGIGGGGGGAQGPLIQGASSAGGAFANGVGAAATAAGHSSLHCSGCQRCVCPGCGQGLDPAGAPGEAAASAAAAAAAALQQHQNQQQQGPYGGVSARPTAGPGMRAWVARTGTLRRVSIGGRPDQVWAGDRQSMDRRPLAATSVAPQYS